MSVVTAPIGPPCTVAWPSGRNAIRSVGGVARPMAGLAVLHGYRVPDDYAGPDTVHRGQCVRHWVTVRSGRLVVDECGRGVVYGDGGSGKVSRGPDADEHTVDHIEPAEPPALLPPLQRRTSS